MASPKAICHHFGDQLSEKSRQEAVFPGMKNGSHTKKGGFTIEQKFRFQMRISEKTDQAVKAAIPLANCRSQNEFVEKALLHYCAYLQSGEAANILSPMLVSAIRGTVQDSENRTARLLFKLAVEVDMMMHLFATAMEIEPELLEKLRTLCVREIKKTNGSISFRDVVEYQRGGE